MKTKTKTPAWKIAQQSEGNRRVLLQTADDPMVFEEVDEFTFKNLTKAIDKNDKPKYTGGYVLISPDRKHTVCLQEATADQLGVVARIVGASTPGAYSGGFHRIPTQLMFNIRGKTVLRVAGVNYYPRKTKTETQRRLEALTKPNKPISK